MGILCESTHTKWGKYRTWFIFTPVVLMVFYPIRKYFPAIAGMKERIAEEQQQSV